MAFTVTEYVSGNFESIVDVNADGTLWDLTFDIESPQTEFLAFNFNYTKQASANISISSYFETAEARNEPSLADVWFQETYLTDSASTPYTVIHATAGLSRIIVPVSKTSNRIKITIVADVATGTDSLVVFASENAPKGNR